MEVDEARAEQQAGTVDRLVAGQVGADPGDRPVRERDVGLERLPVAGQDACAADDGAAAQRRTTGRSRCDG
jgi:hypothetical protein